MPLKAMAITLATIGVLSGGLAFYNQHVSARNPHVPIPIGRVCNTDAVMYCGMTSLNELQYKYYHGDSLHSARNIQHIFDYFGISKSDINSMDKYAVAGKVMENGDVYVGKEKVAHDAYTGGRWYLKGSKTVTHKGTKFYTRKPIVSFYHKSLTAYVVMKNNKFQFAILAACGNPITAKPYKPAYNIQKDVRVKGTSKWHQSVTVKPGTHVQYRITVKSTGKIAAKDIVVKDNLPKDEKYVGYTMKRNGHGIGHKRLLETGDKIKSLAPGDKVVYTFEAVVAPNDKPETCKEATLTNVSQINSPALPREKDTAVVKKNCRPQPVVACVDVSADRVKDNTYRLTAKAKADHAKVTSYVFHFGDGKKTTKKTDNKTATVQHTYAKQGHSYSGYVEVNTSVKNGVTSKHCHFSLKTPQPKPVLTCEGLSVSAAKDDLTYDFTARASAKNTKITSYVFHFGDGQSKTVQTSDTKATASHRFADFDKTYQAYVEVNGQNKSGVTSENCKVEVKTPPKPVSPQLLCSELSFAKTDEDNTYSFTAKASAKHTTITSYVFDFGDGNTKTVKTGDETASLTHTYANADQDYTATVTVNSKDIQNVSSSNCQVTIPAQPEQPPVCTAPNGKEYPEGSPECQPCKYNENISSNSEKCVPPTPPELPNTGPGEVIGFFSATSLAGGLIHRLVLRRKASA